MAAFDAIKPGDELWDCHRHKMGNTTISVMGSWRVKVIEVDTERRRALCSWNGNAAKWQGERWLKKLRRTPAKNSR